MLGGAITAIAGLTGLVTQEAILYRAQRAIQASTNLAAMAGAQDINCCSSQPGTAKTTATSYSALNPVAGQTVTMASGYPQLVCMSTASTSNYGLPSCSGPDNANAIVVKQQATVPLIFGGLFGESTMVVLATATAGAGGGTGTALDVMLIVDTTASMNDSDTSCSVSGATRVICAEAGARILLQQFNPSLVQVGLMVFPGVTNATEAGYDYDCASSPTPTTAAYNASPAPLYEIIPLSSDYKTSPTATSLNTGSNLVRALQGGPSGCQQGLDAVGGYGTYYAGIITAAQSTLTSSGRTGVQKVILFLSDDDANAKSSDVPSGQGSNQCHEGISAAAAATAAGTKVYALAYGSPTGATPSSCSTDTSNPISACSAMQQIASTPSMFYSDQQNGSTTCSSSVNSVSELVAIFNQVGSSLTSSSPRLLPNGTS
jgi:hypothetical protein